MRERKWEWGHYEDMDAIEGSGGQAFSLPSSVLCHQSVDIVYYAYLAVSKVLINKLL